MLFLVEPLFAQNWFNKTFNIYDDSARQLKHIGIDFIQKGNTEVIALSMCINKYEFDTLNNVKSFIELTTLNKSGEKLDSANYFFKGNSLSANEVLIYDSTNFFIGGNIFNYAESINRTNGYDLFLIRLNEMADTLWTKRYNLGDGSDFINEIIKCEDGNILLFGQTCRDSFIYTLCDFYLLKVDTNGNEIFRKKFTNTAKSFEFAGGIASKNNRIIIFGSADSTGYSIKPILFTLDINGNLLSKKSFLNLFLPEDQYNSDELIVNDDGSMLLLGTVLFDSFFKINTCIIKLDSSLNIEWIRVVDGSDNGANDIIKFNNKYMMVGFRKDDRLNRYFAMVTVYRENGNKVFERIYGIPNSNFTNGDMKSLNFVSDSTIWVIGEATTGLAPNNFQRTWIFTIDTFGCLSPGCAVLGIDNVPYTIEPLIICPNPARNYIQLSHSEEIMSYKIFDANARLLSTGKYENDIDITNLANGLYYVHVLLKDNTQAIAKVMVSK